MGKTKAVGWVVGAAVLVLVVLGATYQFLYTPKVEATEQTLAQVTAAEDQNDLLEVEVADLAEKFDHLEDFKTELAGLQTQIPALGDLAGIVKAINEIAVGTVVTVTEITPGAPMSVTVPEPLVPATPATPAPPTDGTADAGSAVDQANETADDAEQAADAHDDTDQGTGTATPDVTTPTAVEGFIAIPLSVKVVGGYANVLSFLEQMQTRPGRLYLATDVEFTRQKTAAAAGGKPATADGDLELKISGYYYTLLDLTAEIPAEGEEGEEPTEPVLPDSDVNPFVPLVATQVSQG